MAVETPRQDTGTGRYPAGYNDYPRGEGWLTFAGVMLLMLGIVNVVGGIAAIDDANFFVGEAQFVFSDLNTWGWVIMLTGATQVLVAFGIWTRNQFARWAGVGFASLNAMAQLMLISAFPLWCLAIFAVDVLIIYALCAYGERDAAA